MEKWYIIKDLGHNFDGLTVLGKEIYGPSIMILKIVNTNVMFGDRNLSVLLPNNAMHINKKYLTEINNPETREYDSTNPWGKFVTEGKTITPSFIVSWAQFEDCIQVSVKSPQNKFKTIYSYNFTGIHWFNDLLKELVNADDDVVFMLKSYEFDKTER